LRALMTRIGRFLAASVRLISGWQTNEDLRPLGLISVSCST